MKFVDKLETLEKAKWRGKFVRYRQLSQVLDKCYFDFMKNMKIDPSFSTATRESNNHADIPYKALSRDKSEQFVPNLEGFYSHLQDNIEKVATHFKQTKQNSMEHFESISVLLKDSSTSHISRVHLPSLILNIWRTLEELQDYVLINKLAVSKLCSKRDRLFGFYITNVSESNKFISCFDDLQVDNNMEKEIIKLYIISKGKPEDSFLMDKSVDDKCREDSNTNITFRQIELQSISKPFVYELEALVEHKLETKKIFHQFLFQPNFKMSFLIGICCVLLINLFIICRLPIINNEYSIQGTLAIFPIFRLILMGIFVLWGSGISMSIMDYYNVNYRYMIGIDPECRVTPTTVFSFAALQTSIWIVVFILFITDYRLGISLFNYFNIEQYPLWIYPLFLMIAEFLLFFIPSRTFTYEYRKSIFYAILEVFSHGIVPKIVNVTLRANIVGDIFTTLSKPFGDIEYTITFFVFVIKNNGYVLPKSLFVFLSNYRWMQTIALALPYEIRFFQCWMRYLTDTSPHRKNHLYNMGKYLTGLAIAVVATVPWTTVTSMSPFTARLLWFACYIVGTIYMFIWDIYMDWGLMQNKVSFLRPKSMYPNWYYYSVAFYNLIGRLTWAITLIPITIIDDIQVNAAIINLCVATIEIIRRTLWCTIRLEWEQVHLNPKQPANLWVNPNKKKLF